MLHTEHGQRVLEHFLLEIAGCRPTWTMLNIVDEQVEAIRAQIGDGRAICALSGGVDSAVAAAIVQRAIGDRLTCVYVDHGTDAPRRDRAGRVATSRPSSTPSTSSTPATSSSARWRGSSTPRRSARSSAASSSGPSRRPRSASSATAPAARRRRRILVQGTLYPDVVESGGGAGTSNIKSHHNVGGLPDDLQFELVEPLRTLFKDEVRLVGEQLGLPPTMVWRQPFPGPGLGIRIIGEVTRERLDILRQADAIAREELTAAGLDRDIWQFPIVLLADVRSVGVQGDGRTYGHPVVLRPVTSEDAMTADWARLPYDLLERISTRITNEVREVNRVTLDITSKPPGTIEWE